MGSQLDKLTIRGFKSIESLEDFELSELNILIGANGAGKSNFVEFFRLLRAMVEERLQAYVNEYGPSDGYFYNGLKYTKAIHADMYFGQNRYGFDLAPRTEEGILIKKEEAQYLGSKNSNLLAFGALESGLAKKRDYPGKIGVHGPNWYVWHAVSNWQVYHFHDTSMTAGMRRESGIEQNEILWANGDNLAAFLLSLWEKHEDVFDAITLMVRRIAPYFDHFVLDTREGKVENQVRLTWKQKDKDYKFSPGHFSDGTIRFICLATALLQPSPPSTIVIDEPELGLHPEALSILAGLLRSASTRAQIIVATQSPVLLSEFEPEQVVTVDQVDGASRFRRLDPDSLREWLDEFSLGELWLKGNVMGGINNA